MQKDNGWEVLNKSKKFEREEVVKILLENRGVKTKKEIEEFLNPNLSMVTPKSVGIDTKQLSSALKRIKDAIKNKEQVVVFGDYDVDGICGAAILWETLNSLGTKVLPYIPHRVEEGYGLSNVGIKNLEEAIGNVKLIITVDNGIVANDAVDFAKKQGIDVIITDHHVAKKELPKALAIIHTTKLCGAGVAWIFAQEMLSYDAGFARLTHAPRDAHKTLSKKKSNSRSLSESRLQSQYSDTSGSTFSSLVGGQAHLDHLELVALATVADLVPLVSANRTLLKFGLEELRKTKRPGLLALFEEAGIDKSTIDTYEIGHMIAPRINAMGRLESAMDSLRLVCTKNKERAKKLAIMLGSTNRERQQVTQDSVSHARSHILENKLHDKKLLFIEHESYNPGVIGLVAGKLVEEFYRPAIVLSRGEKYSKASARSISGFNIIEFIRNASEFLVDAGGHPMAAGFTVETEKISNLKEKLEELAEKLLGDENFVRKIRIDMELPFSFISTKLYGALEKLSPFGMANPKPVFLTKKVTIEDMRLVGADRKHIKFRIKKSELQMEAIAFGIGERASEFHIGDEIDIVYSIEEEEWNGSKKLQLKLKDVNKG